VIICGNALGYRLDDHGSISGKGNNGIFSLYLHVQPCSEAQPASYPMSTGGSYTKNKVARA
jgi:hypothetical protein